LIIHCKPPWGSFDCTGLTCKFNITVIYNLHQVELAIKFSNRIVGLLDGTIMFDTPTKNIDVNYVQNIYREDNVGFTF